MSKKDLANVTADLSALASMMPTQRPNAIVPPAPVPLLSELPALKVVSAPKAKAKTAEPEPVTQFSLSLRRSLRKQLARLADDAASSAASKVVVTAHGQSRRRRRRRKVTIRLAFRARRQPSPAG